MKFTFPIRKNSTHFKSGGKKKKKQENYGDSRGHSQLSRVEEYPEPVPQCVPATDLQPSEARRVTTSRGNPTTQAAEM